MIDFTKVFSEVKLVPLEEDEYEMPPYGERSSLLVHITHLSDNPYFSFEVINYDYDGGACFWINEEIGFDFFLDMHFSFDDLPEGWHVIEGITATYYKGDGWMTDDDVEYDWERIRPATQEEISSLSVGVSSDD